MRYARTSDYAAGAAMAAFPPSFLLFWEHFAPSHVGKGGFAPLLRLNVWIGLAGGFLLYYQRSARTYGPPRFTSSRMCSGEIASAALSAIWR